ncbi:MAG: 2,4-dihydroxyhept-2-ene-1,7-dioic acid aldolase [Rhodobacteraceae bacterium]|nr:2,4-dihydroxyhept-2-ene-1,7-dioic acid aldolase [Paracoccaceae bacterium]
MIRETGVFATPNASRYLQQLCKHFAHKVAVDYDDNTGRADLPPGPAVMTATPKDLTVVVEAVDEDGIALARHIIDDHLTRFAFREDFSGMGWQPADPGQSNQ